MASQAVKRLVLADRQPASTQASEYVVLVDTEGNPVEIGGGAPSGPSQEEFDALSDRVAVLEAAGGDGE